MPTLAEILAKKKIEKEQQISQTSVEQKADTQSAAQRAVVVEQKIQANPVPPKSVNPLASALKNKSTNPLAGTLAKAKSVVGQSPGPAVKAEVAGDNSVSGSSVSSPHVVTEARNEQNPPATSAASLASQNNEQNQHFNHPTQPDKMPESAEEDLRANLKMLQENFSDRQLVGQAIPHIMQTLQANPNLREILMPEDCQTMVRALRECYGTAVREKQASSQKRERKKAENSEIASELAGIMAELNGNGQ